MADGEVRWVERLDGGEGGEREVGACERRRRRRRRRKER